jgi:uncharacterized protein YndB with AHSA1/START domain
MGTTLKIVNRVSDESVKNHTKKNWQEWKKVLDKVHAANWSHPEIVSYLRTKYKLTPWWQQIVTTGYEIMIGRKAEGRNLKGEYSITVTKVFPVSNKDLWKQLLSEEGLAIWLKPFAKFKVKPGAAFENEDGVYGEIRTMKAPQRIRLTWQESDWEKSSVVQLYIVPRPGEKCILAIQHEKLTDGRLRESLRTHWREIIDQLIENAS